MPYEGAWRRRDRSGWSAVAELAPGRTVDEAHATGDLGDGESGGARVVAPGPLPASADLTEGASWSTWQNRAGAMPTDTTSTTDHEHLDGHNDGVDSGLSRITRRPPTAGEEYGVDSVDYGPATGSAVSTTAALRGKNSLPQNNPGGVRTPVPRTFRRHDRAGMFGGWLRASQGRLSPQRSDVGSRAAAPGSTASQGPTTGQRQAVAPGFGRPGMLRRPPTTWDEEAVISATDEAAAPAAPSQFWTV